MARVSPSRQNKSGKRVILPKGNLSEAIAHHNAALSGGKLIPHFKDGQGKLHYIDRRGKSSGGGQYFRSLGGKLKTEAGRRATKLGATPTLADYVEVYGPEKGQDLFKQEQRRLKKIYDNTPSATHDVDHINSLNDGGIHHSRNLRMQNSSDNRSDGARGLTKAQKIALMQADTTRNQISLQGPEPTPKQRQRIMKGGAAAPRFPIATGALSNALSGGSGSEIVDRVNGNMHLLAPHLADIGFQLF